MLTWHVGVVGAREQHLDGPDDSGVGVEFDCACCRRSI